MNKYYVSAVTDNGFVGFFMSLIISLTQWRI